MMKSTYRWVRKTLQALSNGLITFILEKSYDPITVKDITDRADVAHAAFYQYSRDKDELSVTNL